MNHRLASSLSGLLLFAAVLEAAGQFPPQLGLQWNSGNPQVSIAADAGTPLAVQTATNIEPGAAWVVVTNFTLLSSPMLIADAAGTNHRFFRAVVSVPTNMAWTSPGAFVMGSPTNEAGRNADEIPHTVTLTKGFFIAKYPVTQAAYLALMGTNPGYYNTNNGYTQDLSRPVEQVSWGDATNYCRLLTLQERSAGRIFTNWTYRLPTEAEWEYACRAGTTAPFYLGSNLLSGMVNFNGRQEYIAGTGNVVNTNGLSLGRTTAVGSYAPNSAGLHDMAGNVWEWCQDWYGTYPTNGVIDPQGPVSGTVRVFRGGAFNATGRECRSAFRVSSNPALGANTIGFRVVLVGP